ncbi:esterase [Synechococcus sp. CS-602]|uniref:lipase family alpha/beta hydrolase n=1 Tax=Synechococcaceae TaxID=1890426 RepID=UPI0008FF6B01|nr:MULTISPECIES: esterase [Synechococcaceae]MCT4364016.1 esterase [Candidatus Regnicoccus frigidus MAG-AL1]APD47119.1 esterase [Synechococcus sp. SynAce01]MCT0204879.1 esterase [Synechococcus sp. CS-602]MCT0245836.1 esterase [Synechococcus sp. CS-601]MCT4368735.1 esterase [Candidatus Regnicoccus frigidus MAG-AL2]
MPSQPIVILGGFLISPEAYAPMATKLEQLSGQPVRLVAVVKAEWLLTVFAFGWARILDRVATTVADLARHSPTGQVTLIGHSSGGVMLRLFLDDAPFQGRCYDGKALADTLVMLGSPHTALRATALRQMVQQRLPGSFFSDRVGDDRVKADRVRYVSVAGDLELPAASSMARRLAPTAYRNSSGDANDRGDGLVPVTSALLEGSTSVVLPGVAHGGAFGANWYGTPAVVVEWWCALEQPETGADTVAKGPVA